MATFRSYDPAIGRWLQIDPLAEAVPSITPYRFGFNNPLRFTDALGLIENNQNNDPDAREILYDKNGKPKGVRVGYIDQPEKDGTTTIGQLISNLQNNNAASLQGMKDYFRLSTFQQKYTSAGSERGKAGSPWSYIYTQGAGWIDISHFYNSALQANGVAMGELVELYQSITKNPSARSYEDVQSNLQGMLFGRKHGHLKGQKFLSALQSWFEGLYDTSPENAPNWQNVPPNGPASYKAYGDNGAGGNTGLTIPTNNSYKPLFAPRYKDLVYKYKAPWIGHTFTPTPAGFGFPRNY